MSRKEYTVEVRYKYLDMSACQNNIFEDFYEAVEYANYIELGKDKICTITETVYDDNKNLVSISRVYERNKDEYAYKKYSVELYLKYNNVLWFEDYIGDDEFEDYEKAEEFAKEFELSEDDECVAILEIAYDKYDNELWSSTIYQRDKGGLIYSER